MSVRSLLKVVVPSLVLAAVGLLSAAPAAAAGDPARGKALGYTCLGCHGIPTYKNVYPTYSVPKLRGQNAEYIVVALEEYQKGNRSHATMHAHAATLSRQDIQDVAAYLAGEPLKSAGGEPVGTAPESAAVCQSCHGRDGVGTAPNLPTLSGQHADYLEHSLAAYKSGGRKNGIMEPFVSALTPADIKSIAAYYSKQKPALATVPVKEKAAK
jgi:cytochrome c553